MYSRVFPGSLPHLYTSYHADAPLAPRAEALQASAEGGPEDALLPRGPQGDDRYERKSSRASGVHAGRSSSRASKHVKGERGFTKTPQQRHARSRNRAKRKVPAKEVWALSGDTTLLPCDLSMHNPKDSVQMVMWLREGTHTPLFSVDYREQASGKPQVWRDNTASTAQRAFLRLADVDVGVSDGADYGHGVRPRMGSGEAAAGGSKETGDKDEVGLMVRDVVRNDSAVYRCRVDFLHTPTRNNRVNLTVVVPPVRLSVEWWMGESGDKERDGVVGLFHEGQAPTLICETRNAWPPPRVVWFEEEAMVDDSFATDPVEDAVENTLTLPPLTRSHHNTRFTCIAINSNLTRPIASTVHLRMALDVVVVEMEAVDVLSAGTPAEVKCTVWGSNPEPHITWMLNDIILPSAKPWVSDDGNRSVSMVSFTPEPGHDGAALDCSAYNDMLMRSSHRHPPRDHQSSTLLVVNYAPRLSVSLGRTLEADNIKEGDDLYFECSAVAKPPPHKVTWRHNGKQLESRAGVLVSNMTLVLQKVARSNAGTYTCHATNSEGSAASPPLSLDVKYAPVCATMKPSQHSVAKHENARITCNVLANPPVVRFSWAFNNTAEAVNVPDDRYVVQGTESVVNYTPVTELDYGTLLCWATNDIGQQGHPCVFQIVAAGKPDPPHNCRAYDVTISSLQVSCLPGDDGGLGQKFVLQVVEANGDYKPVVEVTREAASFSVANLRPATAYRLLITATNAKGESRPAELSAYTVALNHPQHETPAEPTRGRESGAEVAVGVLVGAVLACLPVAIAVVVMGVRTCMRLRAARGGRGEDSEKESAEGEGGVTLLPGQGTPGGVSGEGGSDITTITGGVALTTTLPPTPASGHSEGQVTQVAATDPSSLIYPGGRIYSPKRGPQGAAPPVLAPTGASLRRGPYTTHEDKFDGENELLEITLPPPAAYDQGYQSSYPGGCPGLEQCYKPQEQLPARMKQGYPPQVYQEYQTVPGYPQGVNVKGVVHPNLQYIASVPLQSQGYNPAPSQGGPAPGFATLPHPKVTSSSSFNALPPPKDVGKVEDNKMSTVYNPLTLFSSPTYAHKGVAPTNDHALHTGSLKRGVKPPPQDILRIRDSARSRSASLSSVASNKRESSV